MDRCCFCINLKAGVIIISLLGIVFGIYNGAANIVYYIRNNKAWRITQ
ncbi:11216_t:CDS:2 [Acaulospora morrowiae]|uniref:11216_t:CDS:1 n=1 Tax=Acaulospora morrowiae TaxID=94023 RepID=A0A9N8ZGU8_9GLOM|nr:11216_t:CDS:2 [Acaulospora morrowiae]